MAARACTEARLTPKLSAMVMAIALQPHDGLILGWFGPPLLLSACTVQLPDWKHRFKASTRAALDWSTEGRLTVPPVRTQMQVGRPQKPHMTSPFPERSRVTSCGHGSCHGGALPGHTNFQCAPPRLVLMIPPPPSSPHPVSLSLSSFLLLRTIPSPRPHLSPSQGSRSPPSSSHSLTPSSVSSGPSILLSLPLPPTLTSSLPPSPPLSLLSPQSLRPSLSVLFSPTAMHWHTELSTAHPSRTYTPTHLVLPHIMSWKIAFTCSAPNTVPHPLV